MEKSATKSPVSRRQRTPLGGGKRSRRAHCRKAAESRWKKKKADENLACSQLGESETATLTISGDAEILSMGNLQEPAEQPNDPCTARKKLDLMRWQLGPTNDDIDTEQKLCFMELPSLQSLFTDVACGAVGSLDVSFGEKMGYSRQIRLVCQECTFRHVKFSCGRQDGSDDVTVGFSVNDSMILCFNELGCGQAAMNKFSAIMNISGMANRTYSRLSRKVGEAHQMVTANVLSAAATAVHGANLVNAEEADRDDDNDHAANEPQGAHGDNSDGDNGTADSGDGDSDNDDGDAPVVDVIVSFDGTWHKRGFTSNYGVGIVIDVMTGLVLDYEVLSKYCNACSLAEKKDMTQVERDEWKMDHRPQCQKNYEGSSKGMEKEAALRIWGQSVEKNNMHYTGMLSDGDSVAYKAVCDANFYPVRKLECMNHCDKRMETALRKKAKEERLSGRRYGALIANSCNVLQSYYRNAIMKNLGNSDSMREAIMASLFHCMSTDESPEHQKCPQGPDSWCFCNKVVANGQHPPKHKDHIGTPLSQDVARAVRPIYERMSDPSLLERIQHGRTQNANECLNGQIWARCPKTVHVGADRVNAAVASAVSNFNQGCSHLSQVVKHLGVIPTAQLHEYQESQDRKRCKQADLESELVTKHSRKDRSRSKKTKTVCQERGEGQTYGAGML